MFDEDGFFTYMTPCMIAFGLGMFLGCLCFMDAGTARFQGEAIEKGYATYDKGSFIWKDDLEKRLFLEDVEFFKRNGDKIKGLKLDMPVIPEEFN